MAENIDLEKQLKHKQQLSKKIATISKTLGATATDARNDFSNFNYISYEQVEGKLRDLEEKVGVVIYPEIITFEEHNIKTSQDKDAIRTIINMAFYITDTETGWSERYSWAGADQDTGGKSFAQAITESCKRFRMKLYKISSKSDQDPDGKTTEGTFTQQPSSRKTATEKQRKLILAKLKQKDLDMSYINEQFDLDDFNNLPFDRVNEALKLIEEYENDIPV